MPPDRSLAPRSAEQARRRQVAVAVAAVVLMVALVVGLKTAGGSESAHIPDPGGSTSVVLDSSSPARRSSSSTSSTTSTPSSPTRTHRSTGRYRSVRSSGPVRGRDGQLVTYRVEVERGSGVSPQEFATSVDDTLRHPRGWTAGGHWRFKRVTSSDADLIIRLATPATVDKQCAAAGADTHGYTSCREGRYVLLNLDRWLGGVPHIKDLALYRHYLVNHEVGHGLGKGHERCPRKGAAAPVMLQQTIGLQGCRANPWPRSADGALLTGPPTD